MSKKINMLLSLFAIFISFSGTFFIINHEKNKISVQELTLLEDKDSKIINEINIKLSLFEVFVIFILIVIFVLAIINIFMMLLKLDYKKYIKNVLFITLIILISVIITGLVTFFVNNKVYLNIPEKDRHVESYVVNPKANFEYTKDEKMENKKFNSFDSDVNSIIVKNGSTLDLNGSIINKQGDTKNIIVSRIYGINSGILVLKDSTLNIKNSTINTNSDGSIGIVSVLSKSKVNVDMLTIDTSGEDSAGLLASLGGSIEGDSIKIKTSSKNSPAISSLQSGEIKLTSAVFETNASSSPIIRTNGKVSIYNSVGDANDSGFAYIDGNGNILIDGCELKATGNKSNDSSLDGGFVISKDFLPTNYKNSVKLDINNSNLEIKKQSKIYNKVPMFVVNNNNTIINISETKLVYGSNILLDVTNSNKKKNIITKLNASNQKLVGNIIVDSNSVLEFSLKNSYYSGSINERNDAKKIVLNIDSESSISLTNDCYIAVINNDIIDYSNIKSNGYNIYYNKDLNTKLDGKEIKLSGGGLLKPM